MLGDGEPIGGLEVVGRRATTPTRLQTKAARGVYLRFL